MTNSPLSIDDIRNMRRHGREQFGPAHIDLLLAALAGSINDALSMQLQRDQALRERDGAREALRWALENGASTTPALPGKFWWNTNGCRIEPPAHMAPILAEAMRNKT